MKDNRASSITRELLMKCYHDYPEMQIRDFFKFIHQSTFGCEHMVSSQEDAVAYIKEEYARGVADSTAYVEPLDGNYSRVGLSYLDLGMSAQTLGRLFFLSAKKESNGEAELTEKLEAFKTLANENKLPFSYEETEKAVGKWREQGYPALHHSDEYRQKYNPSYRVIANRFVPFLPLFAEIDKRIGNGLFKVAVEGGSASGKTTLGEMLREVYGCTVLHTDDFFLRPEQRTEERFAEVGGNFDRERFLEEVLVPLKNGNVIDYRRFDCGQMQLQSAVKIKPDKLTVIEGAYSMHPELAGYYDLSVFLDIDAGVQKERILKRNSAQMAERFFTEWIPLENRYFSQTDAKGRCDLCVVISDPK